LIKAFAVFKAAGLPAALPEALFEQAEQFLIVIHHPHPSVGMP